MAFAKLFETEDMGQILVMVGQSHECVPEVRTWVQPAGLAPCSMAVQFEDSVEGEQQALEAFERMDLEVARKAAAAIIRMLSDPDSGEVVDASMDWED